MQSELHQRLADLERRVRRLETHEGRDGVLTALQTISSQIATLKETIMADAASVLAKVTANTDVLKSVQITIDALKEGQTTIAEEIAALKAGSTDFTALDAAVDEQTSLIAGAKTAIGSNT